jgi:hypothetical protein
MLLFLEYFTMCCRRMGVFIPRSFPHSWLITGFVSRLTRRVPLVEQELPTIPEHLSSPPVFSMVRVTRSLVLCVCFVYRLSFCTFSFGHCVVCSTSRYRFWLSFWYLQTLLTIQFFLLWHATQSTYNYKIIKITKPRRVAYHFAQKKGHRWTFKIIK